MPADSTLERLTADIERAVAVLRETTAEPARLSALKERVLAELVLRHAAEEPNPAVAERCVREIRYVKP